MTLSLIFKTTKESFMSLGIPEIILIAIVVLLLFGGKRIPELARSLGKAHYEYKKAKESIAREAQDLQNTVEKAGEAAAKAETVKTEVKAEEPKS